MRFVGVDGCRGGWVSVGIDRHSHLEPVNVYRSFADLIAAAHAAELMLVDIPIGLLGEGPEERICDREARSILGRTRGSSVFRVPVRSAVHAPDYPTASARNQLRTGKRISRQAWGICPKIAEVDQHLQHRPELQLRIRETHPEVCFAALQRWLPIAASKKTAEGIDSRLSILASYAASSADILKDAQQRFPRAALALDDVVDAMIAAITAQTATANGLPTLPAVPPTDAVGLRMEIVCPVRSYRIHGGVQPLL